MSRNICKCPRPPGGSANCESYQLAICRVRNGESEAKCIDPPPRAGGETLSLYELKLANWAISQITEVQREALQPIAANEATMLKSGSFTNQASGDVCNFRLPSLRRPKTPKGGLPGGPVIIDQGAPMMIDPSVTGLFFPEGKTAKTIFPTVMGIQGHGAFVAYDPALGYVIRPPIEVDLLDDQVPHIVYDPEDE